MLDPSRIKAITLDLDDTLWPVWPTIERAEQVLLDWLGANAPATAAFLGDTANRRAVRTEVERQWAHMAHDLSLLRRESIRLGLRRAGDDPTLAEPAFEVFFEQRHRVTFYEDALPALEALATRYPVVALSNGNADVHRVGIGKHFHGHVTAREVGVGKPDPHIFGVAARQAGVAPEAVLHVGDDATLDVLGALGAGMQTAWVNRAGHDWPHALHQPHLVVNDLHALCESLLR